MVRTVMDRMALSNSARATARKEARGTYTEHNEGYKL